MNLILIIGVFVLLLFLEALTDGLVYLSWTKNKYGAIAHISQLITFAVIFILGRYVGCEVFSFNMLWLIFGYCGLRFGFFDLFYNWITGNDKQGTIAIFDKITAKLPFLNHPGVRLLVAFISICIMIQKIN